MKNTGILAVTVLSLASAGISSVVLWGGCSSKSEDADKGPDYAEEIHIDLRLGPAVDLIDLDEDDVFYGITNRGVKTVTELWGELVFYDASGTEVGRTRLMFLSANPEMEGIAAEEKKARWRHLAAGKTMNDSYDFVYLFAGESELREKMMHQWDNLSVSSIISRVVVE